MIFFYGSKVGDFSNIPTSTSLGYNITLPQFRVVLVKAGTDPAHVKLLSDALAKAARSAEFKAYLKEQYADEASFILLTAMYVSGTYGGAITSILFRIPGEPMDVPLLWDGFAMARAGDPAQALGWTLFAAMTGGIITATIMVALAVSFAKVALTFDSPEYFAVVMFGFTSVVALGADRSPTRLSACSSACSSRRLASMRSMVWTGSRSAARSSAMASAICR